jgi:hypothetical protein
MKEKCNWRGIGSLMVITVCLVSAMSPAMTQSSLSLFSDASNATDGEIPEPTPTITPTPTPTFTPTPSPTPTQSPSPSPSSSPTSTPTPGPTPTLTPTPSPSPMPTPSPAPTTPPTITSFAPRSPVYDTEGATRTFNISIDQLVNAMNMKYTLTPSVDVKTDVSEGVILPEGIVFVENNLPIGQVTLSKGRKYRYSAKIKTVEIGNWMIYASPCVYAIVNAAGMR